MLLVFLQLIVLIMLCIRDLRERQQHERKVPAVIERATAEDLKATAKAPKWQTDWTSEYLADEKIEKYSLKTKET